MDAPLSLSSDASAEREDRACLSRIAGVKLGAPAGLLLPAPCAADL
jgi:hypothetical protein